MSDWSDLVGFGRIYSDKPGPGGPSRSMKMVKPASPVAFSHEPKSKKPNVYAETVASFGNF
jgi:hypothetical protein